MKTKPFYILLALGLMTLLVSVSLVTAQPVRNSVLGDVTVIDEKGHSIIHVEFNLPVRILRHDPLPSSDQVRVHIEPIVVYPDYQKALNGRESVVPEAGNSAKAIDVVYEGSDDGGRYLSLYLSEAAAFEVESGKDYRSIDILVWPLEMPEKEVSKDEH